MSTRTSWLKPVLSFLGSGVVVLTAISLSGCINAAALMSKMVIGDPKADSKFESTTGVDLQDEQDGIILHCSAPMAIADEADSLTSDIESDLIRRMKQKELTMIDQNRIVEVLDSRGGRYDTQVLIEEIPEARYLFEIMIERYQLHEPNTPNMYHGRCAGTIVGYEIETDPAGDPEHGPRNLIRVFEQDFDVDYPNGHPVPIETMSKSAFRKKFVSQLTLRLGNIFYDVTTKELF